jgi:hypothetical protein
MTIAIRTPEAPATSKQLWLLHTLTKTDTRNLNITMLEASNRIQALMDKPKVKDMPKSKLPSDIVAKYGKCTLFDTYLGSIHVMQAFKRISKHDTGFVCEMELVGLLPGGKKPHILTRAWFRDNKVTFSALFANVKYVDVDGSEFKAWLLNLPVFNYKYNPVPPEYLDKAIAIAKTIDTDMQIMNYDGGKLYDDQNNESESN